MLRDSVVFVIVVAVVSPTSNTASHDNHEKISSWVSFCFPYMGCLWGSAWRPFGPPELRCYSSPRIKFGKKKFPHFEPWNCTNSTESERMSDAKRQSNDTKIILFFTPLGLNSNRGQISIHQNSTCFILIAQKRNVKSPTMFTILERVTW